MKRGLLVRGEGEGVEHSKKGKSIRKILLLDMTGHISVSGGKKVTILCHSTTEFSNLIGHINFHVIFM